MNVRTVLLLLVCLGLAFWFWDAWALYPLKLLVVALHETGHALATLLAGGRVREISIDQLQGGLTLSEIPGGLVPHLLVGSGGYLGSTLFGAAILFSAARSRSGAPVLFALALLLGAVALLWVRDPFTFLFLAGMVLLLVAIAYFLPGPETRLVALFLGVFTASYALWDIRDDLFRVRDGVTDADLLASATGIPAPAYSVVWGAIALWVTVRAVRSSAAAGPKPAAKPRAARSRAQSA